MARHGGLRKGKKKVNQNDQEKNANETEISQEFELLNQEDHIKKCNIDIDYIAYFDLLHHLKEECEFNIMEGDKFYYLQAMSTLADHDGLIEIVDDGNVQNMLASYKRYGWKPIEIYALSREYDIVPTTLKEHNVANNNFEEMTHGVPEEVVGHVNNMSG
ncbi:hypothetical protein P3X46_009076 [Hevea brasiliensis]|uniref:Uncharacterized protein n=1 Tax=Hevea brasiliensis TaxID=3981 RepID=A0ABQ9MKQ7_HEVBR|nr:hypothetical protein P3X46_009076 [Hevea brasiliensis]